MKWTSALFTLILPAACAPATPELIHEPLPASEGTAVPLGKAVMVGPLTVEPLKVIEDLRCPADATCVWAGRLVIEVNIAAERQAEIGQLTLGESHTAFGARVSLVAAVPARVSDDALTSQDYRFTFSPRCAFTRWPLRSGRWLCRARRRIPRPTGPCAGPAAARG